jgi:hypothetical protein
MTVAVNKQPSSQLPQTSRGVRLAGQALYKLGLGVVLACLSYYLVEKPVLALREKRKITVPAEWTST